MELKSSVTRKVFVGFILVVLLSSLFLFISYPLLQNISDLSKSALPLAKLSNSLEDIDKSYSKLDLCIEKYLQVGSKSSKNILQVEMKYIIEKTWETMEAYSTTNESEALYQKLYKFAFTIQSEIEDLFRIKEEKQSSYIANKKLISIFSSVNKVRVLLDSIKYKNMLMLQQNVSAQDMLIRNMMKCFLIVEITIIFIAFVIFFFISRFIILRAKKMTTSLR
ncbi:MAG: hypothetical protein A2Y03_01490 [Omnitrophica WOR_2 bacterium GWF2_38_59]|nr:MAG: hypothetical protein A2Y06_06560 [Omnitrophica WOR_2 bacterium GWA2_37_7]OGX26361.1 MAG: hypothetical protein A2Y03_01490 [Omnitrophica WOR_2 bacterium GWF2_38_59]OGX46630.1 MAG: hypothetical protein A2243_04090 [Omnitrophica WOR_2 bacterium RIFOXYA2_FULL_38_17]OGX54475.1 MAG: hypothetical protein A2267_07240 [Omnitrophica WOR_2 bacterium RIFOXYA12_FULL_38_10]OGX55560.1 MAG: hypothetical protein A2447_05305 [Omnitrophica WOR_2 bacterium RIFOXYC2_FULL_38_12]OGX59407.1 MAG: hypothetical 